MAITKPGESQIFNYSGSIQSFVIPFDGLYKLDVLGARGSNSNGSGVGGAGGHSIGYKVLKKGTVIYVVTGGMSGYNGGGTGKTGGGNGGGCTHMALVSGLLATIGAANLSKVLIVAGGGKSNASNGGNGGSGGDLNGGKGGPNSNPGTQNAGGTGEGNDGNGSFGGGGTTTYKEVSGGGGGGLYGGSCGGFYQGGGGGSGYIGGVPTISFKGNTYVPSTSNGGNGGNGYAVITSVAKSVPPVYFGATEIIGIYYGNMEISDIK